MLQMFCLINWLMRFLSQFYNSMMLSHLLVKRMSDCKFLFMYRYHFNLFNMYSHLINFVCLIIFCTGRGQQMFVHDHCHATVGQIAYSFKPRGMLGSEAASVGIYLMNRYYLGSDKFVVPYWVIVCPMSFDIYSYQIFLMHSFFYFVN